MESFTDWLDNQVLELSKQEYLDFLKDIRSETEVRIEAVEQEIDYAGP